MKKRLKGLLALWLAFLMSVPTPMTTYAATTADVYFYNGTTALSENASVSTDNLELLTSFQVDTSLSDQFSSKIPTGYSVTGWNLWQADSNFSVSSAVKLDSGGTISQTDFDTNFSNSTYVVLEPLLVPLYTITFPTDAVGYTVKDYDVTSVQEGASYYFGVVFEDGYAASSDFAVCANGTELAPVEWIPNGFFYSIDSVTKAQVITVTGVEKAYAITTTASTNGSVTVKRYYETSENEVIESDVTEAPEGETVTIATTPAEGYELDTVSVTKTDDSTTVVPVTADNTFIMPADPVTVSATFMTETTKYAIAKLEPTGGSYTVKAGGSEVTEASEGKKVTITATPDTGYELNTITVTSTDDGTEVTVTDGSFTMPAYPVTVSVTFKTATYTITLPTDTVGYTVTSKTTSVEHGSSYEFTVTINDGYAASYFYAYANDMMIGSDEMGGYTEWGTDENGLASCICVINEVTEDMVITVTGIGVINTITTTTSTNGSYTVLYEESEVTEAPEGAYIAIDATPDDGYERDTITVTKTDDSTTVVSIIDDNLFIMPAYPVTVSVSFTKVKYAITPSASTNGSYTVTTGGTEVTAAPEGETVTITATPEEGYELDTITVTNTEDTGDGITEVAVTDGSFTMPACPVTVSVTFKTATYPITLPTDTVGYTVTSVQDSPVEHGNSYEFTVTIEDNYAASADFAVKANNSALTAEISGNVYTYTIQSVTEAQVITVTGVKEILTITTAESPEGSYTVTAEDGSEVTTAFAGDKLTIKPAASEGYELDTITVTKTGDSTTVVTVEDGTFTMPDYPISVSVTFKKITYAITLPEKAVGYTVESTQTSPVEYGSSYTFTVTINDGYDASKLAVYANENQLTAEISGNVYTYTIESVTAAQEITVTGVADTTAPAVTITLDENNWWQSFLNKISFGLFFKEEKSLTIDATDAGSGVGSVLYYLTDTDLFTEDKTYSADEIESVITSWTEYTGSISLSKENQYVLYAKATDQAGNVSYASTTGIVIDTTAPVISGIEDGGTYYGDISFTVSDDYLNAVIIDGTQVQPDGDSYTGKITADNGTHTVTAEDQAGNSVSYEISVYGIYAVTLPEDTVGYIVESTQDSSVNYGSSYTFTVTINDGYTASEKFAVNANNTLLTETTVDGNVYTYTIKSVTEEQEITVTGVVDVTAPTVTITLDENNWWQSFLNMISFGLFFNEEKSLTIDATDAGSGIKSVEYYLTNTDLFTEDKTYTAEEIESVITNWTEYTESIYLSKENQYVLYAKATDLAGNVSYASTIGIVIDTTAPVISGIENEEIYYGDISFTVSDNSQISVTIDGNEALPDNDSYTVTADNQLHTVVAEDEAGNSISYEICVYETWMRDGISGSGVYYLKTGIPYILSSGTWEVAGDSTIYGGGYTFYVPESGYYEFSKE